MAYLFIHLSSGYLCGASFSPPSYIPPTDNHPSSYSLDEIYFEESKKLLIFSPFGFILGTKLSANNSN